MSCSRTLAPARTPSASVCLLVESARANPSRTTMIQLSPIRAETPSKLECRACGTPMRLFGIESHPGISAANLESYVCPRCDGVQTVAVPAIRRKGKS